MATTSITITMEAYEFLKSIKGERSFSELIISFKERTPKDFLEYAGSLEANLQKVEQVRNESSKDWQDGS